MNRWECSHEGCRNSAVGVGGAMGLMAVGWYFEPRRSEGHEYREPVTLCPLHRPARVFCAERNNPELEPEEYCPVCTAQVQAEHHQSRMEIAPW